MAHALTKARARYRAQKLKKTLIVSDPYIKAWKTHVEWDARSRSWEYDVRYTVDPSMIAIIVTDDLWREGRDGRYSARIDDINNNVATVWYGTKTARDAIAYAIENAEERVNKYLETVNRMKVALIEQEA